MASSGAPSAADLIRLAIRVRRDQAELVLDELIELAPGGVEEVEVDPETIEYAIYGAPGELPELPDLRAAAGAALVDVSTSEIADDWAERWREFHRPLVIGDALSVRPPWEPEQGTALEIVIDPGRAFGTGSHATTRMCLELLLGLTVPHPRIDAATAVVDLGCGSGVLGIAAAKLGWGRVLALDYDQLAVDATTENAHANGLAADALIAQRFDLRSDTVPPCRLVFANLLGPLLLQWAARMAGAASKRPAQIIASGLLVSEADAITAAFANASFHERDRRTRGEWAALLLETPDRL